MTRLDENRAKSQLAKKAGVAAREVTNMAIWGNHSTTQFPDFVHARIGGKPAPDVIGDLDWLRGPFLETVQKRGAAVIEKRGASSAASAAHAALDSVRSVVTPDAGGGLALARGREPRRVRDARRACSSASRSAATARRGRSSTASSTTSGPRRRSRSRRTSCSKSGTRCRSCSGRDRELVAAGVPDRHAHGARLRPRRPEHRARPSRARRGCSRGVR